MSKLVLPIALAVAVAACGHTSASREVPAPGNWMPRASGTRAEFRGLVATSSSVVWASGQRGTVARTTDGGTTWTVDTIPGTSTLDFRDIDARGATHAWAMAAGPAEQGQAQIYGTTDGVHWTKQYETGQKGVFLDAISFWDDRHGIAMSDPADGRLFILVTDDGGTTWSHVPAESSPPVLQGEAAFAASGTCLTVQGASNVWIGTGGGARARVFRSTDRGRTWSVADTPVHAGTASSGIFSVAFADARHGVVVGGDYSKPRERFENVAVTDDGGQSWRLAKGTLPHGYMSGVTYLPGTRGASLIAVGLTGTARSNDGGENWLMVDSVAYNSVTFATRDRGWAVGPGGRIAVWTTSTSSATRP